MEITLKLTTSSTKALQLWVKTEVVEVVAVTFQSATFNTPQVSKLRLVRSENKGQVKTKLKRAKMMQSEDNKFTASIYQEFEQKLYKVFGFGIEDLKKVINSPDTPENKGRDLDQDLKEALEAGGAPQLRWEMNNVIVCLEYVFMYRKMGRLPTYEEWANHILSLDIGMTREELVPFEKGMFKK